MPIPPPEHESAEKRYRAPVWVKVVAWFMASWCAVVAGAVFIAPVLWLADLLVMVCGPWSMAVAIVGACAALMTMLIARWRALRGPAVLMLLSAGVLGGVLVPGRPLWLPMASDEGDVQVLQVNLHARGSEAHEASLAAIVESGADVVVITEFPQVIWAHLRDASSPLARAYPYMGQRRWVEGRVPGCVVLSRWPMVDVPPPAGPDHEQVYIARIETPAGVLNVAQIAPPSPRSGGRWRRGGEIALAASRVVGSGEEPWAEGPVVMACDLNATAMGVRGRVLRSAGLAPAKPWLRMDGTWPSAIPGPMRLTLDDVWVPERVKVTSWRTLTLPGSDHRGVVVGLRLDRSEPVGGSDR